MAKKNRYKVELLQRYKNGSPTANRLTGGRGIDILFAVACAFRPAMPVVGGALKLFGAENINLHSDPDI